MTFYLCSSLKFKSCTSPKIHQGIFIAAFNVEKENKNKHANNNQKQTNKQINTSTQT